jgi:hypothetical protein
LCVEAQKRESGADLIRGEDREVEHDGAAIIGSGIAAALQSETLQALK